MRGLWSTGALVLVLAGLGAYIYFVDSERPASGLDPKDKVFDGVAADAIEEVTITSEGQTSTLRKVDGTWTMTAPAQAEADQTEVSSITSSLASLEVNRIVQENAANLADYGLADPRIEVSFKGAGGASGALRLGDKTATQSDIYAMKPGETRVFLVPAYQETTFTKKPFDLRDKRILKFERDKIDSVEIARASGPTIQLARTGSDWVVKEPVQARGDYAAIEGLLTRLSSANMTELVDNAADTMASRGLDNPAVTVTLGAGSTRATLAVGRPDEETVYARDQGRGIAFAIEPSLATDLDKPADDYRDKDLFEFRSFNVDRLRLTRGGETHEFQKVAGTGENATEKWQRVPAEGAAVDVDSSKMEDLLSKLSGLRAQSFRASTQGTSLDRPGLTVSASYDGGKFERVRFARSGADAFATREGEPGAAVLDAPAYDETAKALDAVLTADAPATPAASPPSP